MSAWWASWIAVSQASECTLPADIQHVSASMTIVTIDGEDYTVVGAENRARFQHMLEVCGRDEAAADFEAWRRDRLFCNLFLVGIVLEPLWVGSVVFAAIAPMPRERMVLALED